MVIAASVLSDIFKAFLQGLPAGSVYGLVALGFVLTYKTSGVFNLAFGAQAYVSAAMYFKAREIWGWGIIPSLILAVFVLAPLVGLLLERVIFRSLRTAGAVPRLVVTIGLAVAIPALFNLVANYQVQQGSNPPGIIPNGANVFYDMFHTYSFSRDELVAMAVALVAMAALALLFAFSALGLRMRAVVESSRMTELNGIAADRVSAFSWALSSFFAGLAGVLIAPRFNSLSVVDFTQLMVVAIAAAAVGRLTSLPLALGGGFLLGDLIAQFNTFLPRWSTSQAWLRPIQAHASPAIPFLVLFAVLLFVPSVRRSKDAGDPLAGVDPPPAHLGRVVHDFRRELIGKVVGAALLVGILLTVLTRGDQNWIFLVTQALIMAVIFLSVTVIIGMAGQISLSQGAFAAAGAFTVFQMDVHHRMPVLLAMLLGGIIGGAIAGALALLLRRIGGIWTAIATLAFAYFFDTVVVNLPFVNGGTGETLTAGTVVSRPVLGPFDFDNDKTFLVLCAVIVVVVSAAVYLLNSGTFGRTLLALRGSEVAAESVGISPFRARLLAFCLSGFIAGIGGALLAMLQRNVNYATSFDPFAALFWVVLVVVLGARTIKGALNAAGSFSLFPSVVLSGTIFEWLLRAPGRMPGFLPVAGSWVFVLFGFAAIQYAHNPDGLLDAPKPTLPKLPFRRKAEEVAA
jgi:branched-subunit amino acid ABC-type transport system permease component